MSVPRSVSVKVQWVLDQLVPPIIRDSKWFMYIPMRIMLKDQAREFMDFKDIAFRMTKDEFSAVYNKASAVEIQGETDLNEACTKEIVRQATGTAILEVGCGRGYLIGQLLKRHKGIKLVGSDLVILDRVAKKYSKAAFKKANIEKLPFKDDSFDTVITTHTLEHVQRLDLALGELRRVARKRLIIVVPRQRPYRYNFSLHINFFPYTWSIEGQFGYHPNATLKNLDGDWYYQEDYGD